MRSLALRSQFATLGQHSNRRNGHNLYPLPCLFVCSTPCPASPWERRLAHGRSSARAAKTLPAGTGRPSENSGASAFRITPCTTACPQAPSAPQGAPDDYAISGHVPMRHRNPTLVQAMTQLNMIDHLGYGIERMNRSPAERYLPLPDYDLSEPELVKLTIYGSVVDGSYTRMLMRNSELPFEDILALDRVQKGIPISDTALRRLRRKGLVEGRRPHVRVAAPIAEITGTRASYVESRGKSEEYCQALPRARPAQQSAPHPLAQCDFPPAPLATPACGARRPKGPPTIRGGHHGQANQDEGAAQGRARRGDGETRRRGARGLRAPSR